MTPPTTTSLIAASCASAAIAACAAWWLAARWHRGRLEQLRERYDALDHAACTYSLQARQQISSLRAELALQRAWAQSAEEVRARRLHEAEEARQKSLREAEEARLLGLREAENAWLQSPFAQAPRRRAGRDDFADTLPM